MRTPALALAAAAILVALLAFRPQQTTGSDPWERHIISPKHYRVSTFETQPATATDQVNGAISLPADLGSAFVVTDVSVSNNAMVRSLTDPSGNMSFLPLPVHWTVSQINGPSLTINSETGHVHLAHGLTFNTSNRNPITVAAQWTTGQRPNIAITLAGYTF